MKENNWIDLSVLPKMNGKENKIYWSKCFDFYLSFCFNGINGIIHIIKPTDEKHLLIEYSNKTFEIPNSSIYNCNLSYVIGLKSHNFRFEIDQVINFNNKTYKILNRYYDEENKYKYYTVLCMNCKGILNITEDKIIRDKNCPYCCGRRILVGFNDMWTTAPEQASLLLNPNDGYKYMKSTNNIILNWCCPNCGEIIKKTPNDIDNCGLCCPRCKNKSSYPNRFMYNLLRQLTNNVIREKNFSWAKDKKYDIYFDNNYIIEAHGIQHYEEVSFTKRTLAEEQENDRIKEQLAKENGIENYIVIDCRYSEFEYIKNNVINSELSKIYDLTKVNWNKLEKDILDNIYIRAANLWNSGIYDIELIANILGANKNHIYSIMQKSKDLELCDYNTKITQAIGRNKMNAIKYQKYAKPIICNETKEYFGTSTICDKELNNRGIKVNRQNIDRNLKTGKSNVKGMTFSYITHEEFNKNKIKNPNKAFGELFDLSLDCTNKIN